MRLTLLAAAACLMLTAAQAHAQEHVYEIDGQQLTASQAETVRQADAVLESGLGALQRDDWPAAIRQCYAAVAGYRNAGLGNYGRVGEWFDKAHACVADAQALSGNPAEACRIYADIDYETLIVGDPRAICERRAAREEAAIDANDAYADEFARFSDLTGRLQTLPEGGRARADVAEQMYGLCGRLAGFRDRVPAAFAGASYCTGIVRFEAGQPDRACRTLWEGARWTSGADTLGMLAPQVRHVREMDQALGGFRAVCADFGHPWPAFDRAWPGA